MEHESHPEEIDRITNRVQECIDRIGEGAVYGTVRVGFDSPEWVYGRAVIRATCDTCGAVSVMQSDGYETEMKYLAHVVRTYMCPQYGHATNEGGDDA